MVASDEFGLTLRFAEILVELSATLGMPRVIVKEFLFFTSAVPFTRRKNLSKPKEDAFTVEGTVVEPLPNAMFRVN